MYVVFHLSFPRGSKERYSRGYQEMIFEEKCRMTFESFWCQLLFPATATFPSTRMFQRLIDIARKRACCVHRRCRANSCSSRILVRRANRVKGFGVFDDVLKTVAALILFSFEMSRKYRKLLTTYTSTMIKREYVLWSSLVFDSLKRRWTFDCSQFPEPTNTHTVSFKLLNNDNRRYQLWSSQGRCL